MAKKDKTKNHQKKEQEKVSSFQVQNKVLKFMNALIDVPLHSEQAVARNRISKAIQEKFDEFEKDRLDLIEKYAKRDDNNEKMLDEEGKNYILENIEGFNRDWELLREQHAVFDVLPSNRQYWRTIRDVVKNTKLEMDIELTDMWEELLEALKTI